MPNFLKHIKKSEKKTRLNTALNNLAKVLIVFYQATFSYFLGGNCRYYPSCSHYAYEAYSRYSLISASWMVLKRLLSCHPLSQKNFFDPVPLNKVEKSS